MIKKLQQRLQFNNRQSSLTRPAVPHHFDTEQSSNDYLISLCKQQLHKEALQAFDSLVSSTDFRVKIGTYSLLIHACARLASLDHGRKVHAHIRLSETIPDVVLYNHMLNMYGKCRCPERAKQVFDEMPQRNVVSWTSLIASYSQNGRNSGAVEMYVQMLRSGVTPDGFTFGSVIKACSGLGEVSSGKQLHTHVLKSQFGARLIAQNALIAMYIKFDDVDGAWNVFDRIEEKDLISWGSIIAGLYQLGHECEALWYFQEMLSQGVYHPNEFLFASVFGACSNLLHLEYGRQIHGVCLKFGFARNNFAACSLCDMYAKSGLFSSAEAAFLQIERPDLVSYNVIIAGLANHAGYNQAFSLFNQMRRYLNLMPDDKTLCYLLCACGTPSALHHGMQIHSLLIKIGFNYDVPVCNTLVSMYSKCSNLCNAFTAFEEARQCHDLVSWNAILVACLQHHQPMEVFRLFKSFLLSEMRPDYITLTSVVGAYAEVASLQMGHQIHCYAIKSGLTSDVSVSNGLIDMYTKCGSLDTAQNLFDAMEILDVVSWSSLIVGYAQFGYAEKALVLYQSMINLKINPTEVTLVGVLTACSHVGLVEEGWALYRNMEVKHGIKPTKQHSSCVVDLLSRAGYLYEAKRFVEQMGYEPDVIIWQTLLAACRTHNNVEIGRWVAENILKLDPSNTAAHVLLCKLHAASGDWAEFARFKNMMKEQNVRKVPGQSWVEVENRVHAFLVRDSLHPERDRIYTTVNELLLQIVDHGRFVEDDVEICLKV